jgi:hypothetical protein
MREAQMMMSNEMHEVGPKNASRIWGFLSKFVMLDRFGKTFGVAEICPGAPIAREICKADYLGTALKVSFSNHTSGLSSFYFQMLDQLNPPTKLTGKFLKSWRGHEKSTVRYSETAPPPSSSNGLDAAGITLNLSKRLVALVKLKNVVNIEAGLVMVALAVAISSEVCDICLCL